MPTPDKHHPPACPRCGYDQSGAIATWTSQCPLRGVCSECGLEFRWLDVFSPDRDRVAGFYEHTRGFWRSLWAVPRTARLVAMPWVFWRRVAMHHRPRLVRAAMWLICLLLALIALKGTLASLCILIVQITPGSLVRGIQNSYFHYHRHPRVSLAEGWLLPFADPAWINHGASWVYSGSVTWLLGWPLLLAISTPLWPVCFALLPETRRRAKLRFVHIARASVYSCAWIVALYLPWVIHAAQELVGLLFHLFGAAPPDLGVLTIRAQWIEWSNPWLPPTIAGICWAWLALWWLMAIRRGLRLDHPWGVWASMLLLSTLGTLLLLTALFLLNVEVFRNHPIWFH